MKIYSRLCHGGRPGKRLRKPCEVSSGFVWGNLNSKPAAVETTSSRRGKSGAACFHGCGRRHGSRGFMAPKKRTHPHQAWRSHKVVFFFGPPRPQRHAFCRYCAFQVPSQQKLILNFVATAMLLAESPHRPPGRRRGDIRQHHKVVRMGDGWRSSCATRPESEHFCKQPASRRS